MFTRILPLLLVMSVCAHAQIDLTPHASTRELEGIQFSRLEFRDGNATITYEPPRKWQTFGRGATKLMLVPPDATQAQATIESVQETLPDFDEQGIELLKQRTLNLVPKASEQHAMEAAEVNSIVLNSHPTCEITASFVHVGQRFKMSTLFVSLGTSQLRFQLLCREPDFPKLYQAFRSTVPSWQWVQPRSKPPSE